MKQLKLYNLIGNKFNCLSQQIVENYLDPTLQGCLWDIYEESQFNTIGSLSNLNFTHYANNKITLYFIS